jgi:hypothetical protein
MKLSFDIDVGLLLLPLCFVLIILKLTGVIGWSWWVVCSPLLFLAGAFGLAIMMMLFLLLVCKVVG